MLILVKVVVDKICGYLESVKLIHGREIYSSQVIIGQFEDKVLKVYELSKEKAFIDKASWPLKVKDLDALTNREVATICEQKG